MTELFPIVDDAITVDRSTLESFADCPRRAAFAREHGDPTSKAMASGQAVHDAISEAVREYITSGGDMAPQEIEHSLTLNLRSVRPDLQPDALEGFAEWMRWQFGRLLAENHAGNILRFDGGEGEQSGQLARDIRFGNDTIRVTSELDLLMATRCPDVLDEHDWKTGWTPWDAAAVAESFQFQLHWWIVSEVFPDAQHLDVTIWATRHGKRTDRVRFSRRDLGNISTRVLSAVSDWWQSRDAAPAQCEARPFEEKCRLCRFSLECFDAECAAAPETTPEQDVDRLVQLTAAADLLRSRLWDAREARGADIVSPLGNAFGWDKPKGRPRKPENPVYRAGSEK